MGNKAKRRKKIESKRNIEKQYNDKDTEDLMAISESITDSLDISNTSVREEEPVEIIEMKCVVPNTSFVPNAIQCGNTYFRDKNITFHGNKPNQIYGLFFTDSFLMNYAGMMELDYMEEVINSI